LLTNTDHYVIH